MDPENRPYDRSFYEWVDTSALHAADVIVPVVRRLVNVGSVVDVGCGTGRWLKSFAEHGTVDILGLDSPLVPADLLNIDVEHFRAVDLSDPPSIGRQFDLAVSLEVAEHLPAEASDRFVAFLCTLAPVILFSAAIPGQEGEAHINEQWPAYWYDLFASHGFEPVDVLRPIFWNDERVDWFYRQNMLLYVRSDRTDLVEADGTLEVLPSPPMALVHPLTFSLYQRRTQRALTTPLSFSAHARALPGALKSAITRRLSKRFTALRRGNDRRSGHAFIPDNSSDSR